MIQLQRRPLPSRGWSLGSPVLALFITLVLGTALLSSLGHDPIRGLSVFFWEPIRSAYAWGELLVKATPLLLIATGLTVAYRSNVWNIGAEGQYVLGAVAASWKDRFNANEILVSLMLVYVAILLLQYLVYGPWKDPAGYNFPQTRAFEKITQMPRMLAGSRVTIGWIIALLGVAGLGLFLFRTRAGWGQSVSGLAPMAARYAGLSSPRALWTAMLISGGMAGLAGALEVAGPIGQLTPYVPAGYGFGAIIVAFVGRLHPVGLVFSALLMSMLYIGGELAQSRMGLPKSITGVFQGLLLLCLLACDALIHHRLIWTTRTRGNA